MSGRRAAATLLVLALASPMPAGAAGYAVQEKSPRGLGSSFAGEGALAEDAATVYFNPAGLVRLEGTQVVAGGHVVAPNIHFQNQDSHLSQEVGGGLLSGRNSGAGEWALLPVFYVAQEVTSRFHVGLGVNTPFGLATEYEKGWVGRYHALKSSLKTISILPSLGLRVTDWLSLGAGMTAEHAKATLTSAVDFGSVCEILGPQNGLPAALCPGIGLAPQQADGLVRVTGSGWGYGWHVGALFEPRTDTRIGLTYHSRVDHDLDGKATFGVPKPARILQATGALVNTGAHATTTFPDTASLSAFTQVTPRWAVFGDVTWTHWSLFEQLVIRFDNPAQPAVVDPYGWRDSFRYALGVRYDPWARWTFRAGTAYDETPVASPSLRTPRIPDTDRIWASLGVGYRLTDAIRVDFGYAHVFALEEPTRNADPTTHAVLRGNYSGSADIVGIQASMRVW